MGPSHAKPLGRTVSEEHRENQQARAQRADVGWAETMNPGKIREAGRGWITGLVGRGEEFVSHSSGVMKPLFENCLPSRTQFHAQSKRATGWARLYTLPHDTHFKPILPFISITHSKHV